jgi:pimeloyl-ACP methyl ester carboxylesterase
VIVRAALLALLATPAASDGFLLVHGAFTGEYYWDPLVAALGAEGHQVVAVSLTGQGARMAENGPAVTVETHVADILAAASDLPDPLILVGHSYGTRPMTGAWDRLRDRVAHVVYIEGPAPATDELTAIAADTRSLRHTMILSPDVASSGLMPPPPQMSDADGPLAPMSLAALYGEVAIAAPLPATPGTYITAVDSDLPQAARLAEHMAAFRGWAHVVLPGGHDVVGGALPELTASLLGIAAATD